MATNTEKIVVQVQVKGGKQLDNLDCTRLLLVRCELNQWDTTSL